MKLGLEAIVVDALKELSAADAAYMALLRSHDHGIDLESVRHAAYRRQDDARERVLNLAKALFPPPPVAPCKKPKKRAEPRTAIVRAANDSPGHARPRGLPPPPPTPVEITIVAEAPMAPRQTSLLGGGKP